MILGAFLSTVGHHEGAWRYPTAYADAACNIAPSVEMARKAESGKLHFIFFADAVGIRDAGPDMIAFSSKNEMLEPLTLLPALAMAVSRIGLIATASTTYNEPFHLARKLGSIDHISHGRCGWNIVTSAATAEAENFGQTDLPAHDERYHRADEFIEVLKGLWDSWDDDAFLRDKETGQYLDPSKARTLNHKGQYYSVKGPLNLARPPQGYPVFAQAGSSGAGRDFSARNADLVFTATSELAVAREFYQDLRQRGKEVGRDGLPIILPGVMPVVGGTREEAQAKAEALAQSIHPQVALTLASRLLGVDLRRFDLNGPVPDKIEETNAQLSRQKLLIDIARKDGLSVGQLCQRVVASRGHWQIVGSATDVANEMQHWFEEGVADGFMILPSDLPEGLDRFVDEVVPILQERGLFQRDYRGSTLRESLGLARPDLRSEA
jgi:FMN-dependent oxidoreductase (nitrilotriacetate monooxygenase family)